MILTLILSIVVLFIIRWALPSDTLFTKGFLGETIILVAGALGLGIVITMIISSLSFNSSEVIMNYEEIVGTQYTSYIPSSDNHIAYVDYDQNIKVVSLDNVKVEDMKAYTLVVVYEAVEKKNKNSILFESPRVKENVTLIMRRSE